MGSICHGNIEQSALLKDALFKINKQPILRKTFFWEDLPRLESGNELYGKKFDTAKDDEVVHTDTDATVSEIRQAGLPIIGTKATYIYS